MKNKAAFSILCVMALCFLNARPAYAATRAERYEQLIKEGSQQGVKQEPAVPDITRPVVEYQAGDLRDPFQGYLELDKEKGRQPKEKGAGQAAESFINSLQLQGVIWGGRFPQAIINEKVVKVGDTLGEARIVEINKEGVSLFLDDRIYKISSSAAGPWQPSQPQTKEKKGGTK